MVKDGDNTLKCSTLEDTVSCAWTITSDVSNTPDDLLDHLDVRRGEELDEVCEDIFFDQVVDMVSAAGSDVG